MFWGTIIITHDLNIARHCHPPPPHCLKKRLVSFTLCQPQSSPARFLAAKTEGVHLALSLMQWGGEEGGSEGH